VTTIAVIGPGAVGGTVAAWLAQDPALRVTLCARTPVDRLQLDTPAGPITASPEVLTDPAQARAVDWVLVAVKAYDSSAAAVWLPHLLGPETRLAVLQNGVEHRARFAPFLPEPRIIPAVVDIPAERTALGRIRQRRNGSMLVPAGQGGDHFTRLFAHTPIEVATTPDWTTAAWRKLCLNSAGAVSALTLQPAGVVERPAIAALMRDLAEECAAVGRAVGADLPPDIAAQVVESYRSAPPDSINSMHADRLAGRPMEIDARNGVIVRLGRTHGVPTPANAAVAALLEAL
jgi:2-dehydropantoate 2-reductase